MEISCESYQAQPVKKPNFLPSTCNNDDQIDWNVADLHT